MNIWSTLGCVIMRVFHRVTPIESLRKVQLKGAVPHPHRPFGVLGFVGRPSQVPEFY